MRRSQLNQALRDAIRTFGREIVADVVFTRWHTAFIAKAHGGADEFGNEWPPLAESTRRRKAASSMSQDVRRGFGQRHRQLLSQLQAAGMSPTEAVAKASSLAWQSQPSGGGQININTTRLEQSLDPSRADHSDQIRDLGQPMRFGTRTPYAKHVNRRRRIMPTSSEARVWVRDAAAIIRNKVAEQIRGAA